MLGNTTNTRTLYDNTEKDGDSETPLKYPNKGKH